MSYDQQIQEIMEDWLIEHDRDAVDADAAAEWGIETDRFKREPPSMKEMLKQDMLRVLRKGRHTDKQGRIVKTRYSMRYIDEQGVLKTKHLDLRISKPAEQHESFTQHFDRLGKGVHRHAIDVSSYNDNNLYNQQIPLFDYDMSKFVALSSEATEYNDDYDDSYDGGEADADDGAKAAGQS